jgi:beta-lactam-binding protein with PASTA domain/predicted Ser/Thr protein kinase
MDVLTGRMLDRRYHVRSRIAHGGMATVYLATDTRLDREVALKVMHADLARDAEFVGRFIGEAKSVARLSHPNVAAVYDQGADGQYLFLAMEYVPGRTLRALLRERGWLPWNEVLEIIDPVLAGLSAAHRAGIVHRDVKPENVLITPDGRVKVVDFGLARASAAMGQTRAGVIIGSVAYIAPEQVTGAATDARTDVYAAGIMAFEMMTGRQPYTGETPLAVAYAHVNSDVPAISDLVTGIPPAVDQLVRSATSRDPQRRPPNADAFLHAVRALRGAPETGESITGSWAVPAETGAAAVAGLAGAAAPRALVVGSEFDGAGLTGAGFAGAGFGSGGNGSAEYGSAEYAATGRYDAGGAAFGGANGGRRDVFMGLPFGGATTGGGRDDGHEPFLQRWLFSTRLAYVAVAVVALLAIGIGGWWLTAGRYRAVPDVAGLPEAAASAALVQAGFHVRAGSALIDNNVPKNDVVSISPSGRALPGATITVTVSRGPRMITVPPVAGKSVADATTALRAVGLTVSSTTKAVGVTGTVVVNSVAGTTPAAGTSWPQDKPVTIEVVAGLSLPPLTGEDIGTIQQWAGQNHINLQQTPVASNKPQGIIVAQSPAAGTPVPPGGTVNVSVSQGPPQVQIPNLQGQPFQQAQQTLQNLGFTVVGKRTFFGNKVISTNPSGQAPQGSTITVYYGGF